MSYKLVVGLGNPGSEYAETRHNMGFMLIEKFLKGHRPERWEKVHICNSYCYVGSFAGAKLILQLPQTYMNNSGTAVAKLMRQEKIEPSEVVVVYDDMDLEPGRLRIRRNGASGGHHGIDSIIAELGSASFKRLRVGIGRPEKGKTADYVLSGFEGDEEKIFAAAIDRAAEAVRTILAAGMTTAMNKFNAVEKNDTEEK